jgi:hypothetical protein
MALITLYQNSDWLGKLYLHAAFLEHTAVNEFQSPKTIKLSLFFSLPKHGRTRENLRHLVLGLALAMQFY